MNSHRGRTAQKKAGTSAPGAAEGAGKWRAFRDIRRAGDADLLAELLDLPPPRDAAVRLATQLLQSHGGLRGLASGRAALHPGAPPIPARWRARLAVAAELSRRQLLQSLQRGQALTSPAATLEYLQASLRDRRREVFACLFLDTRHRLIASEELFQGSIDGACVYPRVVAERSLRLGAAAVIVAHNHPSGVGEPSLADQSITRRLKDALSLLEIRLLDHFIIGDDAPVSLASRGML